MALKAVFFDIGSTLWRSPAEDPGALAYCYGRGREYLVRHYGDAPSMEELIEAVEGYFAEWEDRWKADVTLVHQPPTTDFVRDALLKLGLDPPHDVLASFTDAVLETSVYTAKTLEPEPGMPEALEALRGLGLRLACVSNAFMGAGVLNRILEERGLGAHCELTLSSCELGVRKPHPRIYEEALEALGVAGAEAVFVGDRLDADVEGPARLGMRTVLTHQYRREDPGGARVAPDAVIAHLSELPGVLKRWLA
ncbi:MAG TPA: HAD family hydrolase [Dehalococcoidia bacterium]|nr:HAD family hydrolase [Dehalococcoidia bacterium]